MVRIREALDGVTTVVVLCVAGLVAWDILGRSAPATTVVPPERRVVALPAEPLSLDGAQLEGEPRADVVVIEYSDFQCPYCRQFAKTTLPRLKKAYVASGRVQLAFRHFPLDAIHPFARDAAVLAECAGDQGAFWPVHDRLFSATLALDPVTLTQTVEGLRLDQGRLEACRGESGPQAVEADVLEGRLAGVTGTPTFLIGQRQADGRVKALRRLTGARPFEEFVVSLDSLLGGGH